MEIRRRVTARFSSRRRKSSPTGASPSIGDRGESDVRNLPAADHQSGGLVATVAAPRPISLSAYLRTARAHAEEILWQHPRRESPTASTCQLCLVTYPCDAIRAAEDVITISEKLHLCKPLSGAALLELMTQLVDLSATDTGADPSVPRGDHRPGTDDGLAQDTPRQSGMPASARGSATH
jgi:hypothetical protein